MKNYGFVTPNIDTTQYVLGGLGSLPKVVLQPDGQWDAHLPTYEPQFNSFYDSHGCTVWGNQNAIEILVKKLCGREDNYSERFTYILAGIRPPGADPHKVAEVIRKNGVISESELPMTQDFIEYVKPDPMTPQLLSRGQDWLKVMGFGHEWVYTGKKKKSERIALIKEALQYSPVGVSVSAWNRAGEVYVDRDKRNNHWCICFGYDDSKNAWKIFDSYDQSIKLYSYDASIEFAKRYHLVIKNKEEQVSKIKEIVQKLLQLLGFIQTNPNAKSTDEVVIAPVERQEPPSEELPKKSLLIPFCEAIRDYEGEPGDLNYRNNNPGNCKYSPVGYHPMYGEVKKDARGFAIFKDYATGWLYLQNFVKSKIQRHPNRTIREFFYEYAPPTDGNSPELYAIYVARRLGVEVDFITKNLL